MNYSQPLKITHVALKQDTEVKHVNQFYYLATVVYIVVAEKDEIGVVSADGEEEDSEEGEGQSKTTVRVDG